MYWKFLRRDRTSPLTGFDWNPVGTNWVILRDAQPCRTGIHACRLTDLPFWMSDELWSVELTGRITNAWNKVTGTQGRLISRVDAWNDQIQCELADACVRRTVEHSVHELRAAEFTSEAEALEGHDVSALPSIARDLLPPLTARRADPAAELCRYIVDIAEGMTQYPVATIAYMAARAADQRTGAPSADFYGDERAWQASWIADRLQLRRTAEDTPS